MELFKGVRIAYNFSGGLVERLRQLRSADAREKVGLWLFEFWTFVESIVIRKIVNGFDAKRGYVRLLLGSESHDHGRIDAGTGVQILAEFYSLLKNLNVFLRVASHFKILHRCRQALFGFRESSVRLGDAKHLRRAANCEVCHLVLAHVDNHLGLVQV